MRQALSRGSKADEGNAVLGGSGDRRTLLPALCARPYLKKCGGTLASQCEAGAANICSRRDALSKGVGSGDFIRVQPTQTD